MTRDVSADYDRWARGDASTPFAPDSPFGGDHLAVRSGRIDEGRAELDRAVQRQLAQTGSDDYDAELAIVLSQCRSGVLCLSQVALEGTGINGVRAGREVIALAAAPVAPPLGEPPVAQEHTPRFRDAVAYCVAQRPDQAGRSGDAATQRLIERCDPATANRQIHGWIQAGGAKVVGVRFG